MINIDDVKSYLKIDYGDEDNLISDFIRTSERLVKDVGRLEVIDNDDTTVKTAMLFSIGYLYENRSNPDYHKLILNLRSILFAQREGII